MATTEELIVTARWQGQSLQDGTKRAQAEMTKLTSAVSLARTALVGMGVALSAKQLLDYAEGWTKVTNQLRLVTENVERTRAALLKVATDTGSSLEGTVTLYARMTRATRELGLAESQRIAAVKTINQVMALSGATASESAAALLQLSQAFSSNRLAGEEFRAIAEQAPMLLDVFAESLGVTAGRLREMAMEGKITGQVMLTALAQAAAETDRQFKSMDMTVSRALENLQTAAKAMIGLTNESAEGTKNLAKAIDLLAQTLPHLSKGLDGLVKFFMMYQTVQSALDPLFNAINRPTGWFDAQRPEMWKGYKQGPVAPGTGGAAADEAERDRQRGIAGNLASYRADVAAFGNDDAQEVLKLQERFAKELADAAKNGYGPEQVAQLKAYQAALLKLTVAHQGEERAAKAAAEATKAAADAKREAAQFDAEMARADKDDARRRAEYRQQAEAGRELLAGTRFDLAQATRTPEQQQLALFDAQTQRGAEVLEQTRAMRESIPVYRLSRLALRDVLKAEQDKGKAEKEAADAADRAAKAQRELQEALRGVDQVLRGIVSVYPEFAKAQGLMSSALGGLAAGAAGDPFGVIASGLDIVGQAMGLFGDKTDKVAEAAAEAAAKMAQVAQDLRNQAAGIANALGGTMFADARKAIFRPVYDLFEAQKEAALAQARSGLPAGAALTNAQEAQALLNAVATTLQMVDAGQLGEDWNLLASILMGTTDYASIAATALNDLSDGMDEAAKSAQRLYLDMREMALRQQAAAAFRGTGGDVGAQARIYRELAAQVAGLGGLGGAAGTGAGAGASTAPGTGTTPTPIQLDTSYFAGLLAGIPTQVQAALDAAFAALSLPTLTADQEAQLRGIVDPLRRAQMMFDEALANVDPPTLTPEAAEVISKTFDVMQRIQERLDAASLQAVLPSMTPGQQWLVANAFRVLHEIEMAKNAASEAAQLPALSDWQRQRLEGALDYLDSIQGTVDDAMAASVMPDLSPEAMDVLSHTFDVLDQVQRHLDAASLQVTLPALTPGQTWLVANAFRVLQEIEQAKDNAAAQMALPTLSGEQRDRLAGALDYLGSIQDSIDAAVLAAGRPDLTTEQMQVVERTFDFLDHVQRALDAASLQATLPALTPGQQWLMANAFRVLRDIEQAKNAAAAVAILPGLSPAQRQRLAGIFDYVGSVQGLIDAAVAAAQMPGLNATGMQVVERTFDFLEHVQAGLDAAASAAVVPELSPGQLYLVGRAFSVLAQIEQTKDAAAAAVTLPGLSAMQRDQLSGALGYLADIQATLDATAAAASMPGLNAAGQEVVDRTFDFLADVQEHIDRALPAGAQPPTISESQWQYIGDVLYSIGHMQEMIDTAMANAGLSRSAESSPTGGIVLDLSPTITVDPESVRAAIAEAVRGVNVQAIIDESLPVARVQLGNIVKIAASDMKDQITAIMNDSLRNRKITSMNAA